ncbi:MAG: pyrimidine dimer DNA glycosylase/endonuclease V [Candidatus Omnitrophica bacterium]|nr:pyrimidine dimer DNA glycosylase/endonuclease V [Candidatus Omnitrophota bacterium]MDD5430491.1 pyrimidine dimer DNA glycosylase/endonuclease V [Candidatus Omnitrophota bacterium]
MRLWSIHPKYLDTKGLLALWREALLAKKVLQNKTKGYKKHPQLLRFKSQKNPVGAINYYLYEIFKESKKRGFNFSCRKACSISKKSSITVTSGQIKYEFSHLLAKLRKRDAVRYRLFKNTKRIKVHPIFRKKKGEVEPWEKL